MEFKEFSNPESRDYDINSSLYKEISNNNNTYENPYQVQLIDLIGILEDITEEELQQKYGISINEYLSPTADTIAKVSRAINGNQNKRHK